MGESQGTVPTPSQAGEVGLGVHWELCGAWEAALLCALYPQAHWVQAELGS